MKKQAIAVAFLCASFICSPAQAKTFVGVLWPMFGPLPAIGLAELVAELKMMPDVEVTTYLHQSWPSLVEDIDRQPPGTHTVVIGYSLGANSSVFVANKAKYVDLIIALQPSMLSWNPPIQRKVGKVIEIYNPNPWMTFGGMGSKKLTGGNIEYIANNDSHPGAQFDPEFRNLVKSEVAKFSTDDRVVVTAQAAMPRAPKLARLAEPPRAEAVAFERPKRRNDDAPAQDRVETAEAEIPQSPKPAAPEPVAEQQPPQQPSKDSTAFLDTLSRAVNSGDLPMKQPLTRGDMMDYAQRTYDVSHSAGIGASEAEYTHPAP